LKNPQAAQCCVGSASNCSFTQCKLRFLGDFRLACTPLRLFQHAPRAWAELGIPSPIYGLERRSPTVAGRQRPLAGRTRPPGGQSVRVGRDRGFWARTWPRKWRERTSARLGFVRVWGRASVVEHKSASGRQRIRARHPVVCYGECMCR